MNLFKSKYEKHLDDILNSLKMNMSNNYKDNAQANLKELESTLEEYRNNSYLSEKATRRYEEILEKIKPELQGYTHKDQKPYWT